MIGDSAFQLKPWLITPFRNSEMGDDGPGLTGATKRHFNKTLSSARVVVEHAFGVLKARFRRLTYLETKSVRRAVNITCAACVLHNMCVCCDDDWEEMGVGAADEEEQEIAPDVLGQAAGDSAVRRGLLGIQAWECSHVVM